MVKKSNFKNDSTYKLNIITQQIDYLLQDSPYITLQQNSILILILIPIPIVQFNKLVKYTNNTLILITKSN